MPRQLVAAEFKTFVKGIVTEVSPLTFPDNASLDEENFVLNRDGSRERRLGLDIENNASYQGVVSSEAQLTNTNSYRWLDGKGVGEGDIVVVQVGSDLLFYDAESESLSSGYIGREDLTINGEGGPQSYTRASFTRIGKRLVVAFGGEEVWTFKYEGENSLTKEAFRLKIRDFFGVGDLDSDGTDMTEGVGLLRRPSVRTDAHIYNLRNQSWGQKYYSQHLEGYADPIRSWNDAYGDYPANNDITTRGLYADTENEDNRTLERFWEENVRLTDYGTGEPPKGAFILDFINRSDSRLEQINKLEDEKGFSFRVSSLPPEREGASAKSVASYSGRIFYAGFPGAAEDTNTKTPDTASFVLFTQLIKSGSEFGKCYQEGDPTSRENSDLLATDGGYVQVEDAFNIHTLITTSQGLMVVAANGVWQITGGSGYSFSADNFLVKRLTDKGSLGPSSVVYVDDTIIYWSEEGIFQVSPNNFGDLVATNISKQTIQTLYDEIDYEKKEMAQGRYDPYEGKVRWLYGDNFLQEGNVIELVLDTSLGAFYKNNYKNHGNHSVVLPVLVPPYNVGEFEENVTVDGEIVTVGEDDDLENVTISYPVRDTGIRGMRYLVVENVGEDQYNITFATVSNPSFLDWQNVDGVGADAYAFILTGYFSGGDTLRKKQVMKMVTYFRRSETGFEEDTNGDWVPVNTSSCLISSQWDWTDNVVAGRWSSAFQAYRIKRPYFPESFDDEFDNGEPVVVSQSKLRGRGRVVSLKIETEQEKDLQLLGWAMVVGANNAA